MDLKLSELAELVNGKLKGDGNIRITSVGDIETAGYDQITFIKDKNHLEKAKSSQAAAFIVSHDVVELGEATIIQVDNPHFAFVQILNIISSENNNFYKGIHPTVITGNNVKIGNDVSIGPYTVIGDDVTLNDETLIRSNVCIGDRTSIGANVSIYPNVSIAEDTVIGNNVIIYYGAVIGRQGHGYIPQGEKYIKVPQVGRVVIEDDVEIGANACIDKATITETVICHGTKIDNLVHIAHNVRIGENSQILAHTTIAGSTIIGKHAIFSGQTGAIDNLTIGDNVIAGAGAGILQDVSDNSVVWGTPAIAAKEQKKIVVSMRRLPDLIRKVKELEKQVEQLKKDKQE